jgi:hypothetical protein
MSKNLDLIKLAREITASGLPFMEGKEKGELKEGETYKVKEYGYLESSENGETKQFVVIADDKHFYFGGSIVTDNFKKLDGALNDGEIKELLTEGIEIKVAKRKSKGGRTYTTCEFFPND